jgi:hypothetical protein
MNSPTQNPFVQNELSLNQPQQNAQTTAASTATVPTAALRKAGRSKQKLDTLIREGWVKQDQIWRASNISNESDSYRIANSTDASNRGGISTGYNDLNQQLPNGGWPARGLTELLHDQPGIGEIRLLAPALAALSQEQNRWIVWVAPPCIPYAPALASAGIDLSRLLVVTPEQLADKLWVLEKAMASSSCSAVLAWPEQIQYKQLRRLQIASKTGDCFGVLFRSGSAAKESSPAELRIRLDGHKDDSAVSDHSVLNLEILKRKGGWPTATFALTLKDNLNQVTPEFHELPISQQTEKQPELVYMEHLARSQHVLQ